MMERNGILLAGKRVLFTIVIGLLCSLSLSADYKLVLTDVDGNQTQECVKSYSFSNNLESIANQNGVSRDIYSTEETLTNKIYMGKPVYRRVLLMNDFILKYGERNNRYSEVVSKNLGQVIKLSYSYKRDGIFYDTQNDYVVYGSGYYMVVGASLLNNNKIRLDMGHKHPTYHKSYKITDIKFYVEYTKTTDVANSSPNKFQSYLIYKLSSSTSDEVITKDMENLGVQLLKGYSYDASTNSCTKN